MAGSGMYVALPGDAVTQGDGTLLWRSDDGRTCALVTADELDLLDHCGTYDTLAAHAARATAAHGIDPAAARTGLERLVALGLLTGFDDARARAPARTAPAPRPRIVVRVLGGGDRLPALLAALAATPPGVEAPRVDVLLPGDEPAPELPATSTLNVRFHDATARARHWQRIAATIGPVARARCAALLDVEAAVDWPRASWHWALLLGRGSSLAVLDDHDDWPPRLAPRIEPGLTVVAPARQTAWGAASVDALGAGPAIDDALGLATPYLGQPAATLAAAYPGTAARTRGAARDAVLCPGSNARIRCIAFGQVLRAPQLAELAAHGGDALDPNAFRVAATMRDQTIASQAVAAHTVRTGCLVRSSGLVPVFVDARELLPPMPAAGGSKAWLALLGALDADAVTLELPVLRLRMGSQAVTGAPGDAMATLIDEAAAGFVGPRLAPSVLAARLADLATADDAILAQAISLRWHDVAARQLAQIDTAARAPSTAPTTRAALDGWREALEQQMLRPLSPVEAAGARRTLAELATTLPAWAELWSATDAVETLR
jgi:hypothetical protein